MALQGSPVEEWREVKGYEGLYMVSNLGRVLSLPRNGTVKYAKVMKHHYTKQGYDHVALHKNDIKKEFKVHRLVAQAFIPNPDGKPEVNHVDGDKKNNAVTNLEWATRSENITHSCYTLGHTMAGNPTKPVFQYDREGNFVKRWSSLNKAAKSLTICSGDISRACNKIRKSAGGFRWAFKKGEL